MSEPELGQPRGQHPARRLDDRDRERVTNALRQHCTDGRITLTEFEERLAAVLVARTDDELAVVTADLPAVPGRPPPPEEGTRWFVGIFGDAWTQAAWRPRTRTNAVAVFGDATIDVTKAVHGAATLDITAVSVFGDVEILVADGTEVEIDGVTVFGETRRRVHPGTPPAGTPRVVVTAYGLFASVTVTSSSEPRTVWGRLRQRRQQRQQPHAASLRPDPQGRFVHE